MFSIRFHGRGGQGMKTASHFLGNAFFLAGFEVQDAPRYGAERRGVPMTSTVRADRQAIFERGIIRNPGLIVVADDSLIPMAAAGVLNDINRQTVLLLISHSPATDWRQRLNLDNPIKTLPPLAGHTPLESAACAGAAAGLTGMISRQQLTDAIAQELSAFDTELIDLNIATADQAYASMLPDRGIVKPSPSASATDYQKPEWVELTLETADIAAPVIHAPRTSVKIKTGLWRTQRPVIDAGRCHHCWWICSSSCPDSAINIEHGKQPVIDYDHCKGCMICVVQCPAHAIDSIPERDAIAEASR